MARWTFRIALIITLCGLAAGAFAQTTGGLVGRVTDGKGKPVSAAIVDAKGPALQGSRSTKTDDAGRYRLSLLPPGTYTVTFEAQGFAKIARSDVVISLDRDATLNATLTEALVEEVEVSAAAPVIAARETATGAALDELAIQTLPTDRNYLSIAQVVPGVAIDANINNDPDKQYVAVYGSSGAENVYLIDGVNTTDMEYGFQGHELNSEFIQEVDVKTGGYEAEHGRSTGGIVNVITKSGGNEFHGDLFGYFDNQGLQSGAKATVSTGGTVQGFRKSDFGVDFGGYMLKDKLWFFVAYNRVDNSIERGFPGDPLLGGTSFDSKTAKDLGSLKLTWKLNPNHSLIGTFFLDPTKTTGAISDANHALYGDPLTYDGEKKLGGNTVGLRYEGIVASNWVLSAQVSRQTQSNTTVPAGDAGDVIQYRDLANNSFQSGGFGLVENKDFTRTFFGGSATWIASSHEVKAGIEYEEQKADVVKRNSGGQQVDIYVNPVDPNQPIYRHNYWTTADATPDAAPVSELNANVKHKNSTLFLQDKWTIVPSVTLAYGLRWDRQEIFGATGEKQIDLKNDYAPRIGITWDPWADQKTKIYAHYGRFYEQIPMDLVIRSYSFERQARIINFSPTSNAPDPAAEAALGTGSAILGGSSEPTDPNLRGQYLNEYLLGGEREVARDWSVGGKFIYRSYGEVIEDFLCQTDGTYCIGNPGKGIMQQIYTLDYNQTFPAPKPTRIFRGIEVDAKKRFSHNWQGMASYLYSTLKGNFDGEYAPFTNVGADPNISAAYDYYDFFTSGSIPFPTATPPVITNSGYLSNDRRHQFKVSGSYTTPVKLIVGLSAYWQSGTPLSRMGYSDAYGRYEFFLTQRGSEGRTPDTYEADLHLTYPLAIKKMTLNFMLDVFNLLDAQRPLLLDQRWGFQEADNASPTPVNPTFGQPVLRTPPRQIRLALRLSY